jgi:hypothetical protein
VVSFPFGPPLFRASAYAFYFFLAVGAQGGQGAWSLVIDTLDKLEHSGTVIRQPLGAFHLLRTILSHFEPPRTVGQADARVEWVWGEGGGGVAAQDVELAEESKHASPNTLP